MRRTTALPAALVGVAVLVLGAGSADAAAQQQAKDISIRSSQLSSYDKDGSKAGKGPVSEVDCGTKTTYVPKGATYNEQSFTRLRSHSQQADGTHVVEDHVTIKTILAKDEASAKKAFLDARVADKHCTHQDVSDPLDGYELHAKVHVSAAPALKHTDRGYTETVSSTTTVTGQGHTLTLSGDVQVLVFQRGRAITAVSFSRGELVAGADGSSSSSITYSTSSGTRAELKRIAKLTVAALAQQTAA